jgi:hypothetical protein
MGTFVLVLPEAIARIHPRIRVFFEGNPLEKIEPEDVPVFRESLKSEPRRTISSYRLAFPRGEDRVLPPVGFMYARRLSKHRNIKVCKCFQAVAFSKNAVNRLV